MIEPGRLHRALTIRLEHGAPVDQPRFAEASESRTGEVAAAQAWISPIAPRPVATPQFAQSGAPQRDEAREEARTGDITSHSRQGLVQAIQKELRRVGCYQGALDGDWDGATRKAMTAFNERVNASLPVAQPDYILLMLVQGHSAKACGAACPAGQGEARDGTCQPRSVLAEARRKAAAFTPSSGLVPDETASQARAGVDTAAEPTAARTRLSARRSIADESSAEERQRGAHETAGLKGDRPRALPDDPRIRRDRELIAAAEERKRRRAAEAKARTDSERAGRMAELERAWALAEARRREGEAARTALGDGPIPQSGDTRHHETARPKLPTSKDQQGRLPGQPASVDLPPAGNRAAVHVLTRPADARFIGRFFPPPTYRVGRLPPSPGVRIQASSNKARPTSPAVGRGARLQAVFRSVDRHSP